MSGPLAGIRIVDMTTMLSGPWAAMILADQGADVIKVEVPDGGDHVRSLGNQRAGMSAMFLNINRNKRSVSVDVKNPRGREIVLDLAKGADVFMQNFRPGVVDRLGVGEADIRRVAPDIVYASISGFGDVGPWVGKPVYDPVIQAVSGLTTVQAGSDQERPRLIRTVLPDKLAAVTVAQSISAALVSKAAHRRGPARAHLDARLGAVFPVGLRHGRADLSGYADDEPGSRELHRPDLRDTGRLHDRRRDEQQGVGRTDQGAREARVAGRRALRDAERARPACERAPSDDSGGAEDTDDRRVDATSRSASTCRARRRSSAAR